MKEDQQARPAFTALGLSADVLRVLEELGYEEPTPIQAHAIPLLISGRDVLGSAATGTGKTAAFALPLIERLEPNARAVQGLILTPTRELAMQVADALAGFARRLRGVQVVPVYGGAPFLPQQRALARGQKGGGPVKGVATRAGGVGGNVRSRSEPSADRRERRGDRDLAQGRATRLIVVR